MPVFEYQATNQHGNSVKGTVLSGSISQAADELARQGLNVVSLGQAIGIGDPIAESAQKDYRPPPTEQRSAILTDVVGPIVGKVSNAKLLFFFRQLGTMLKAGVPMVQSLDTLSGQAGDIRLKTVLKELKGHVMEGRAMSVGLQRYPEIFSPMILSLIRVGESGGMLENSCRQIADYLEGEIEMQNLVRRVTIYPKLVLGASMVAILGANTIIRMAGKNSTIWSPLTEVSTWVILGPILIGLFLFYRVGLANPRIRHNYEQFILKIPYYGTTVRQLAMARFGRAFGALYAGGVPVHEAMKLGADACGNEYMRSVLHPLAWRLEEGNALHPTLVSAGVFSPIVLDMVHTGETTGNVNEMLTKMADFYEDDAKVRATQSAYAIGVVALSFVGAYVGYVVFNFYSEYAGGIYQTVDQYSQ